MAARELDVVVYGATGFTGRLVAEHLARTAVGPGAPRWAIAGRDAGRLAAVKREIGAGDDVATCTADASDPAALDALVRRADVVITTVGPYQLYGEALVAACARTGTDYVDLCGEPAWMASMIRAHEAAARQSGARIVFSCGFDSIPFDLGVWFLQQEAIRRTGRPAGRVRGRVLRMKGDFSGGTLASMLATLEAGRRDPSVVRAMVNPYALVSDPPEARQPRGDGVVHDADLDLWAAPFVMAAINTKNVHRTNALAGYRYGRDFTYDEMESKGGGAAGEKRARGALLQMKVQMALLAFGPTRALLQRFVLPKPGEGPDREARESGYYEVLFAGTLADGSLVKAVVRGDKDPGYGSTSKMLAEAALCLGATPRDRTPGGIWTPAAAMGDDLVARLVARAGLGFSIEG